MRKHSPYTSSDMEAGIGMPLMAATSPMISPKRSAIRRGLSLGTTVASVEAPEWENSDAELGKTSSKEVRTVRVLEHGTGRIVCLL